MPTVRRSAWYAHGEAVLQAMLCSDDKEERRKALVKIQELRGVGDEQTQLGNDQVRPRRTPPTVAVKAFQDRPMEVPSWPSHTQSVERCVIMTTEAAQHVYSEDRRMAYIRGQVASRDLMSRNRSKADLASLAKFDC